MEGISVGTVDESPLPRSALAMDEEWAPWTEKNWAKERAEAMRSAEQSLVLAKERALRHQREQAKAR